MPVCLAHRPDNTIRVSTHLMTPMHLSFVRPRVLAFAALAAAIASTPLLAQRRETGAFVVRLGNDTIALEQYARVGNRIEGDLLSRVPATRLFHWVITVSKAGLPQKVEYFPRNPDGTTNPRGAQSITLTFAPDSITRETKWVDSVQVRRLANDGTVLPAFGTALATYELGTRWMRLAKRDSAGIRFMGVNAAQLPNPLALRMWRDSARLDFFGNPMLFRVDRTGRILSADGSRTTLKLMAVRVPAVDIARNAVMFAARDRAGAALGVASTRDTVRASIGAAALWVDYGRPSLRGRSVWVNGVLGDTLWRTGANAATQFRTDVDLTVAGAPVPAGLYTLWTHTKSDGTYELVLNRQTGQWGTVYDRAQDLVRVPLTRAELPSPVERFTIMVEPRGSAGVLKLAWDTTELSVPIAPR